MTTPQRKKPWDFSHVLDLVNALSSPNPQDQHEASDYLAVKAPDPVVKNDRANGTVSKDFAARSAPRSSAGLGDFDNIWHFLGTQPLKSYGSNDHTPLLDTPSKAYTSKADYTSDGAIRYGARSKEGSKRVTWKEETSADEPIPDSASDRSATPILVTPKLTKSQRKKQNRRERKAKATIGGQGTVSESEADTLWSATPARKASTHAFLNLPAPRYNLRSRSNVGLPTTNTTTPSPAAKTTTKEYDAAHLQNDLANLSGEGSTAPPRMDTSMRQHSQPLPTAHKHTLQHHEHKPNQWPITPITPNHTRFLPASVQPRVINSYSSPKTPNSLPAAAEAISAVEAAQAQLRNNTSHDINHNALYTRQRVIEPKIVRSGEDRHWALLLKLINEFNEDRRYLVSPMNLTTHNNDPNGIHVFVDASNIFIGFNDQLKRSRGIPLTARVPPVTLSFDALALLMERRRPVAKRILAGSTPYMPVFDKAKAVGYECNILEKVYKAKELTDRQMFFRDVDRRQHGRVKTARDMHESAGLPSTSPSNNFLSSDDGVRGYSGSETASTGPQYAPAKMIEQGVDEILHLKILETIVDNETPATMVIATGDAAQAEYSDGFMAMAQRALKKGWKVELVSWSKNISSMYLRSAFRDTWRDRFRVVLLDDYAEELLDM